MDNLITMLDDADPFRTWWPIIIAVTIGIAMTIRTMMGGQKCPNMNLLQNKIIIITGGYSGIGYEITNELIKRYATIIIACKDIRKGEKIRQKLQKKYTENCHIIIKYLDLCSFDSIYNFIDNIKLEYKYIDIIINNAGIIFHDMIQTTNQHEIHLQVNYLGPFLLTYLLIPLLKNAENGRIINVSAHAHVTGQMLLEDPLNINKQYARQYHQRDAFAHSKLAVILGTKSLAKQLQDTNVTVNVYTPGLVRGTDHLRKSPIMSALCVKLMTFPWMWLFMKNPKEGAQCAIYLATEPKLDHVTGQYFNDCEIAVPSELAQDEKLAERLFIETKKILKLE